jgi:hypothetical protein
MVLAGFISATAGDRMTFLRQRTGKAGPQEGRHLMRKTDLDHMLELAVAKALGVKLPHMRTAARPARKNAAGRRPMRHAA